MTLFGASHGGGWKPANAACILLGIALLLTTAACSRHEMVSEPEEPEITHGRFSEFNYPLARVYLPADDIPLSVNSADDAVEMSPGKTVIPGHQARNYVFLKEEDGGTSVVYAVFNWNSDNPADYLMFGEWAWFADRKRADLSFEEPSIFLIVDGPELDPRHPPEMPLSGTASYSGRASGLYSYDRSEDLRVRDEYEAMVTLTADFGAGTVAGCIGCDGEIVTRVSRLDIFRGRAEHEEPADLADYEFHLHALPYDSDGNTRFTDNATVKHPTRDITTTEGYWAGFFSNVPDDDGNPRLVTGFNDVTFEDENGEGGRLDGSFVAVSETYRDSTK